MKILILSFYYQPDLCAGSFRCTALVEQLKKYDVEIEVITTLPNRYASFTTEATEFEQVENVRVRRILLPAHQSGMMDQIKSFLTYYQKAIHLTENEEFDLVFATSSRLFTAFLGSRIARKKGLPLYLDIRDIFVDTIKDVLPSKISWFVKPVFKLIERYTFKRAPRINLVSKGFSTYFEQDYPRASFRWFTNGIDAEFMALAPQTVQPGSTEIKTIVYAGNIGEGQGLHKILPELSVLLSDKVKIRVIGDGGRKVQLARAVKGLPNVELLLPVSRQQLINEYQKADILFLHLNDYPAFEKVLPSKIFEYAATGKPVLAGVAGYSARFLKEEVENCAVFYPGNAQAAVMAFTKLNLDVLPRKDFVIKYSRDRIMHEMAEDIMQFAAENA